MKSNTVGRPHNSSVVNLPVEGPPPSPIGPLSSRGTHKALAAFRASEKKRRHCCCGCLCASILLLLAISLTIGLLYPRVPSINLSPAAPSVGATVAVSEDGAFTFTLRAVVVVDASSSYAPWQVKAVGFTLMGTSSSAPAFALQYEGTLTARARARTTFTVRVVMGSAGIGNLVPALALISSVASGAPTTVIIVVAYTPVYLGVPRAFSLLTALERATNPSNPSPLSPQQCRLAAQS